MVTMVSHDNDGRLKPVNYAILFTTIVTLLSPVSVIAAETVEESVLVTPTSSTATPKKAIRVITDSWPPYSILQDGQVAGTTTKTIRAVLTHSGLPYTLELLPWNRGYSQALKVPGTCIYSLVRTEKRETLFQWVGKIQPDETSYTWKLQESENVQLTSLDYLYLYRVVTQRNSMGHEYLKALNVPEIEAPTDIENTVEMFITKRADILVMQQPSLEKILAGKNVSFDRVKRLVAVKTNEIYLACQKDTDRSVVLQLRKAVNAIKLKHGLEF